MFVAVMVMVAVAAEWAKRFGGYSRMVSSDFKFGERFESYSSGFVFGVLLRALRLYGNGGGWGWSADVCERTCRRVSMSSAAELERWR